jgi:hypothetical protein
MDMWEPYVRSTRTSLPAADDKIVFDKECAAAHSLSYGESYEMLSGFRLRLLHQPF